jgi:hypothetical protein
MIPPQKGSEEYNEKMASNSVLLQQKRQSSKTLGGGLTGGVHSAQLATCCPCMNWHSAADISAHAPSMQHKTNLSGSSSVLQQHAEDDAKLPGPADKSLPSLEKSVIKLSAGN